MDEYLARPGQTLQKHTKGVVANARILATEDLEVPSTVVAHLHDLGKLTTWFQKYIRCEPVAQRDRWHAAVGATVTLHALAAMGQDEEVAVAGFYAVLKHHGVLPDFPTERAKRIDPGRSAAFYERVEKKFRNIDDHAAEAADERIRTATDGALGWGDLFHDHPERYRATIEDWYPGEEFYPLVLQLWSTLTCADKLDAAGPGVTDAICRPEREKIHFESEATGIEARLNTERTAAREEARDNLCRYATDGESVFTLTLPTGFGKTFAGLDAGLRLADRKDGRLVYALPFTTVIDQIHEEIVEMFGVDPRSDTYTVHHHLANTRTRTGGDEEPSDGTEALYGESWQSGLVLTTFVQLFESLAGPGNVQSMKLPALQNAVVVVDEPQALPRDWWHLVSRLVHVLVERYDATVVLMTATQPRFIDEFDVDLDPVELVDSDRYFSFLADNERVEFQVHESVGVEEGIEATALRAGDAAAELVDALGEGGNVLSVNNTVAVTGALVDELDRAARESYHVVRLGRHLETFYRENAERVLAAARGDGNLESVADEFLAEVGREQQPNSVVVAGLTSALRPCDRALLVEAMRHVTSPEIQTPVDSIPLVVVSTQLIEAGVDVSFDTVYRDFAPVPSIVQTAGRCNRSFEGDQGRVVLWRLTYDGYLPSRLIYADDVDTLQPTRIALREAMEGSTVSEQKMVATAVREYYRSLHEADETTGRYDPLVQAYENARGDTLRDASLITDQTEDVLLLSTQTDREHLDRYLEAREGGTYQEGRISFNTLEYMLASVTSDRLTELPIEEELEEFTIVDATQTDGLYDLGSGRGLRSDTG